MVRISRYIFILLLISPFAGFSQHKSEVWRYEGPRFGVDLSRFMMPLIQGSIQGGFEVQGDFPYKGNFFPTVEIGYQSIDDNKDKFHYTCKGPYTRLGIDLNIAKFESLSDNDLVLVGARYGFSRFTQETPSASYTNYWGTLNSSFPKTNLSAHWAELVFGLKGELAPNLFLGWTVRAKFKLSTTKDPNVTPYQIPGLGNTSNEVPFDFSLTMAYRIPLIKTKTLPKPLKAPGPKQDPNEELDPNDPNYNNRNNNNRSGGNLRNLNMMQP